jgi:phosphatidate cytidylyltransferase
MAGDRSLHLRVLTGLVLVAVALAALWLGGMAFRALVALAVLLMWAEWAAMLRLGLGIRRAGLALLAGCMALTLFVPMGEALLALAGGAGLMGLFARSLRKGAGGWTALGLLYCGLPALALLWLRDRPEGLAATVFVLVVVWAADTGAFFVGRAVGGPKLAPRISPKKTWSGAVGGIVIAMLVAGALVAAYVPSGLGVWALDLASVAGALAGLSVLGDLFESGLKRHAGVKESGTIVPGHGGVMDRLDGVVPVAVAGAALFWVTGWAG